jgi:hypothetical protein
VDDYGDWMVLMNGLCGCMVVVVVVVIGCSGSWEGMEIEGVTEYGGGGGGGGALVVMGGGRGRCWGWIMDMGVVRGSAAQRMQQSAEQCRHYRRRMRTNWGGGGNRRPDRTILAVRSGKRAMAKGARKYRARIGGWLTENL